MGTRRRGRNLLQILKAIRKRMAMTEMTMVAGLTSEMYVNRASQV